MKTILYDWLIFANVGAFIMYGVDKYRATQHLWRIRETTLILWAFGGGALGALLGMHVFRHKTKHIKFITLVPIALVIWIGILGWVSSM